MRTLHRNRLVLEHPAEQGNGFGRRLPGNLLLVGFADSRLQMWLVKRLPANLTGAVFQVSCPPGRFAGVADRAPVNGEGVWIGKRQTKME